MQPYPRSNKFELGIQMHLKIVWTNKQPIPIYNSIVNSSIIKTHLHQNWVKITIFFILILLTNKTSDYHKKFELIDRRRATMHVKLLDL